MQDQQPPFRVRLARTAVRVLLGSKAKEFVQPLSPLDGWSLNGTGRLNQYTTRPEQLAANLGWVFAANEAIVNPCAAVPLVLYRRQKDGDREQIFEHDLLDLLASPNYAHTGEQLFQLHYTYMNLTGESYILMLKNGTPFVPRAGQLPDALQVLPTHRVRFKLGETYLKSEVKIDRQVYPITTIIRDFNPDPANPYYGRSIVSASAQVIDMETQMVEQNRRLFANGANPSLVFNTNQQLSDSAYQRWKQQFMDEHTGSENTGKPMLIEGGNVTPLMMKQRDLEYLGGREFSMKQILSMFKVSPGILGQVENVNRSNLEAGFYQHAVENVVPRVRQFVHQLNATLVKPYDATLELDFESPVPEDMDMKLKTAKELVDSVFTKDEVRDMYGEKPLPDHLGEHIIVTGMSPATLESIVNGEPTEPESVAPPEDDDGNPDEGTKAQPSPRVKKKTTEQPRKLTAEERRSRGDAKVARHIQRSEVYESAMLTALQQQFDMQRSEVLSRANAGSLRKALATTTKASDRQQHKRDWLAALLAWAAFNDAMRKALAPILFALIAETGKDASQEIGLDPSQFNPTATDVLNYYQHRATKIAEDVNAETEKQLRASLGQGIDAGETDNQLRARIELVLGFALTTRAARIARTEANRAQGFADQAAWQQSGIVTGKEWYVQSNNPCPFCRKLDGVVVSLDSNFYSLGDVIHADGKTMAVNYDDVPYPPVHVNCQCAILPITLNLGTD